MFVYNASTCDLTECTVSGGVCGPSPLCTLRCFDTHTQYDNKAFNNVLQCMLEHNCSAQMHGNWPDPQSCTPPPPDSLVKDFNLSLMEGRWYITRGLSAEFDVYNCQVACNRRVGPNRVNLTIWYDITFDDGSVLPQVSNQSFYNPDAAVPAHLQQHAWMNGVDDWYVIAAKEDSYWFVKYCGCSDTWCGYGGGFVYTRTPTLDPAIADELRVAAKEACFDFDKMTVTKNPNCGIEPTPVYGCP